MNANRGRRAAIQFLSAGVLLRTPDLEHAIGVAVPRFNFRKIHRLTRNIDKEAPKAFNIRTEEPATRLIPTATGRPTRNVSQNWRLGPTSECTGGKAGAATENWS
jgi:hypothetical protein